MNIAAPLQLHVTERALRDYPGRTCAELANDIGADREILRERLLDLEASGKAHQGPNSFCRITGRSSPTWQAGKESTLSQAERATHGDSETEPYLL